jgi:hypothetical protein
MMRMQSADEQLPLPTAAEVRRLCSGDESIEIYCDVVRAIEQVSMEFLAVANVIEGRQFDRKTAEAQLDRLELLTDLMHSQRDTFDILRTRFAGLRTLHRYRLN